MQQLKKYILSIVAGGLLIPATAGAFDYNLSIDEISESPLTAYNTIYFENYFKCPNKRMAREMYARLSGTIYASMENFPSYQSDKEIRWIEGDVTIVTYIDERKDDAGYYTVVIRRYNNTVMNQ